MIGEDLVRQARTYLGVKYHHCGRSEHGLDCSGLILRVAHDLGLTEWDEVDYSQQVNPVYMKANIERFCDPVDGEPQAGDVLWLSIGGVPQHVAMATGEGTLIHATNSTMVVVEVSFDKVWRRRLMGVFRWRGLE